MDFVELEGIEPSSKQGSNKLSTCLSPTSIFEPRQDRSHQSSPYPLKNSPTVRGHLPAISDFTAPPNRDASEKLLPGDVSF